MTNFRPLFAGLSLAAIALTFVGVGAYRKYHVPAPAPVPIVYAAPAAAVVEPKVPEVTPPPPHVVKKVKHPKAEPRERVRERVKAKKAERKKEPKKAERAAPSDEAELMAKLRDDAKGAAKLSCKTVLDAVKRYPEWLLKKMESVATPEQKERGAKCLQQGGDVK